MVSDFQRISRRTRHEIVRLPNFLTVDDADPFLLAGWGFMPARLTGGQIHSREKQALLRGDISGTVIHPFSIFAHHDSTPSEAPLDGL